MAQDIIDQILHKLPSRTSGNGEAVRVMTIRIPATLHAALKEEASDRHTSANKLAVAKLAIRADILDKVVKQQAKSNAPKSGTS